MNARDKSYYMSLCLKHGIKIYPIVESPKRYRLAIERNGQKPKIGDEIYPNESTYDRESKQILMSVYDKIHELYTVLGKKIKKNLESNFKTKK